VVTIPVGVRTAVDYRLRMEAARARVTQALALPATPPGRFDTTVEQLLVDALHELDTSRDPVERHELLETAPPEPCPLSIRHLEILELLADGLTLEQVGQRLDIRRNTVKSHLTAATRLAGLTGEANTTGLVCLALRRGWIT
jgi:DNA-binding NarL/FixJ family response regulator